MHGSYSGRLTIATSNDIIIDGNTDGQRRRSDAGADRQQLHPHLPPLRRLNQTDPNANGAGSVENISIDAAILAINHSFIVDNYDCGASWER